MKTKNQNNMISFSRDKACLVLILGVILAAGIITVSAQADKKQGRFVAVSGGYVGSNTAAYSEDGINWTQTTMPENANWQNVCYGNGKFVAVAYSMSIYEGYGVYSRKLSRTAAYSNDGINWKIAALPYEASWIEVCYGNGKFVAVAGYSDKAAYSNDGINWKAATLPDEAYLFSICYGNGKFVAAGKRIAVYSNDGINWKSAALPDNVRWASVCYGNGKFVAAAYMSNIAAYSNDGIIWKTTTTLPNEADWWNACYGQGKFVAVGRAVPDYDDENRFIGVLKSNIGAYSVDGIKWTEITLPTSMYWESVFYGNDKFIAITQYGNITLYSNDGINWKVAVLPDLPIDKPWTSVCYGGD